MKHSEVIELKMKLEGVKGLNGFDVNYSIKRNLQGIKAAVKPLIEMEEEALKKISKYTEEVKACKEKFATLDDEVQYKASPDGKGVMYDIPKEKEDDYKKELNAIKKKHKAIIKKYDDENEKYLKFLKETESPFKPHMMKKSFVPKDISTENMERIFELIKDSEE